MSDLRERLATALSGVNSVNCPEGMDCWKGLREEQRKYWREIADRGLTVLDSLIAQATADALEAAAQDLDAKSIEWEDKRDESNESLVSYNYGYFSGLTEGFRVSAAKIRLLSH